MTNYGIRPSAIVIHNNKVLVVRSKYGNKEFYLFPGGGLERFETIAGGAKRETLEETGYDIEIDRLVYVNEYIDPKNPENRSIGMFFLAKLKSLQPINKPITDEGKIKEVLWIDLDKIKEIDLRPRIIRDNLEEDYKRNFGNAIRYSVDYKKE